MHILRKKCRIAVFSLTHPAVCVILYFNLMEDVLKRSGTFWRAVRDLWRTGKAGVVLFLMSLFATLYGYIALDYERTRGWHGYESVQNVIDDISNFIPVGVTLVGMIAGGIDLLMLLSDWYLARQEKRIQAAKEEGKAEGMTEGKAEAYQEIAAWYARRTAAEARGESFTEPPPGVPQNGPG